MNFLTAARRFSFVLLLAVCQGCFPQGNSGLDEEKDPHFLRGKDLVTKMDYKGAIGAFQKALEANPKSAAAHFEVGLLYMQHESDPARAIYHFERYLELRPGSNLSDRAKDFIGSCKLEIAKTVTINPGSVSQREMEKLNAEIQRLMAENTQLRQRLEAAGQPVNRAPTAPPSSAPTPSATRAPVSAAPPTSTQQVARASVSPPPPTRSSPSTATPSVSSTTPKSHVIKVGETPSAIARQYGVKLEKLLAANPNLDARRLRPGQTLVIPTP